MNTISINQIAENQIADCINRQFERLGVSTTSDPYSGLSAEVHSTGIVKIFDDYASGVYSAGEVLADLQQLESATLESIWGVLSPHECSPDECEDPT